MQRRVEPSLAREQPLEKPLIEESLDANQLQILFVAMRAAIASLTSLSLGSIIRSFTCALSLSSFLTLRSNNHCPALATAAKASSLPFARKEAEHFYLFDCVYQTLIASRISSTAPSESTTREVAFGMREVSASIRILKHRVHRRGNLRGRDKNGVGILPASLLDWSLRAPL